MCKLQRLSVLILGYVPEFETHETNVKACEHFAADFACMNAGD